LDDHLQGQTARAQSLGCFYLKNWKKPDRFSCRFWTLILPPKPVKPVFQLKWNVSNGFQATLCAYLCFQSWETCLCKLLSIIDIFLKNVQYSSKKPVLFVDEMRSFPYTKGDNQQAVDSLTQNYSFCSMHRTSPKADSH
jgi:hypothetical protein